MVVQNIAIVLFIGLVMLEKDIAVMSSLSGKHNIKREKLKIYNIQF